VAKLVQEIPVFTTVGKGAQKRAEEQVEEERKKSRNKKVEVVAKVPWSAAQHVYNQSKKLTGCQDQATAAVGARPEAEPAWKALLETARMKEPTRGDEKAESEASLALLKLIADAPMDKLKDQVDDARNLLTDEAKKSQQNAQTARVRQELPEGLFPRVAAIGVGVAVALAALVISYISARSVSTRRARALVGLRRFANTPEAGLQAASIIRFAAHHNGGEPGMVLGAALGGLLAAILVPTLGEGLFLGDLYVAGCMGGLLFGLALQWLVRTISGFGRWRERALELGNIEKPTIPIPLVLGGVTPGLEKQFLRYFEALPVADAAVVVQKLAAQAEEQILQAAEAGAMRSPAAAPGGWGAQAGPYG
jgi:hypothetical protein